MHRWWRSRARTARLGPRRAWRRWSPPWGCPCPSTLADAAGRRHLLMFLDPGAPAPGRNNTKHLRGLGDREPAARACAKARSTAVALIYSLGYTVPMNWIRALRERAALTQAALAHAGGTSQPTVAAYEAGRKSPTVSTVQRLARALGLDAVVSYHPPLTREERRSLELHRAIAVHLREDPERVLAQARRNVERMLARTGSASQPLREWQVLLDRPVPALLPLLTDPDPWARELRHATPFAGVLSARERAEVYGAFADDERQAS